MNGIVRASVVDDQVFDFIVPAILPGQVVLGNAERFRLVQARGSE
jgi:hypothetical protein